MNYLFFDLIDLRKEDAERMKKAHRYDRRSADHCRLLRDLFNNTSDKSTFLSSQVVRDLVFVTRWVSSAS